jgi:hypothetical protein
MCEDDALGADAAQIRLQGRIVQVVSDLALEEERFGD